jgi:hydrogenase maturation protease
VKYIIGIGNYSMFDDSIGIRIIEKIIAENLDRGFQAIDLSGNLLNILTYLNEETEQIILVDSGEFGLQPGDIRWFTPDLVTSVKELANISSHEGDIIKVLELARQTDYVIPKIQIMGIQPEEIREEFGLSDTLAGKMDDYVQQLLGKIQRGS